MYCPRLLLLSLLISLCAATAAAQSSPNLNSDSSHPASPLPQSAQASTVLFQFQLPFLTDAQGLSDDEGRVQGTIQQGNGSILMPPLDSHMQHILTLQQDEKTCFTIRAYRVARESPDSDSTRPVGYSTCQSTTRFQLKEAVDSREVPDR
jgi:hypothetical protein